MRVNGHDLMRAVARKHGLTPKQLTSGCRLRAVAWPRQEAMYELFTQSPHLTLPAIAAIVGVRDHTTVRHGIAQHAKRNGLPAPRFGPTSTRSWAVICEAYAAAMRGPRDAMRRAA